MKENSKTHSENALTLGPAKPATPSAPKPMPLLSEPLKSSKSCLLNKSQLPEP